jgi:molybdopterin molybdotransferase
VSFGDFQYPHRASCRQHDRNPVCGVTLVGEMADLITIEEGRRRVLEAVSPLPAETVPLDGALGRVLAADVASPIDVPSFASSAMDGYAAAPGPAGELPVVGESRAGAPYEGEVEPGGAVRISTGALVPAGAGSVVPVERSEPGSDGRVRLPERSDGDNVRYPGEDVRAGDVVLRAGKELGPAEVAVAASLGHAEVECARRPRVAVLVTGDELVEPGTPLRPGYIYSSNGWALAGQVARAGAELVMRENVPDTADGTRSAIERALAAADVVCVSGGVSVGPHDHVKPSLSELGVEERFWGIRLRPGKPTWFGRRDAVYVFGLPGNPVSAIVTFQLFARPALLALQGASPEAARVTAAMSEAVPRNPNRDEAVRVRLEETEGGRNAVPTGEQGSHQLTSMLGADGLAMIPAGEGEVAPGETVVVELL